MTKTDKNQNFKSKMTKRSLARLMAVQALYQYHFYENSVNISELMAELIDNYALSENGDSESYRSKVDLELLESLIKNLPANLTEIDEEIAGFLQENKKIGEIPDVILAILRIADLELKMAHKTPLAVILSEYVDIAACFYDANKVTFVNGILENLAKKNREVEFGEIKNGKR